MGFFSDLGTAASSALGSGLAGVGLNAIGSIFSNMSAQKAEKRQFEYQKQLMSLQNQYQMSNWNEQFDKTNEYNDPANQMSRLMAAGINPNSAAGMSISPFSNSTAQMGSVAPGSVGANYSDYNLGGNNVIGNSLSAYQLDAQNNLLQKQAENVEANTENVKEQTEGVGLDNQKRYNDLVNYWTRFNIEKALGESNIRLNKASAEKVEYEVKNLLPQDKEINEKTINNLYQAGLNLVEQMYNLKEERKLTKAKQASEYQSQAESRSRQGVLAAQEENINASTENIRQDTMKKAEETTNLQYRNALDRVKASVADKWNIDPNQLNGLDAIITEMMTNGASEKDIRDFLGKLNTGFRQRLTNSLYKSADKGEILKEAVEEMESLRPDRVNSSIANIILGLGKLGK